jgi:endonuclease/exonuclease/phosphatase family metal-dependent hydrolase
VRVAAAACLTWLALACGTACARAGDGARADDAERAAAPVADVAPADLAQAARAPTTIRIDGAFDDWPARVHVVADGRYVYVRFALPEERNLQASDLPVVLALDARADGAFDPDLRITFSPPATGGLGVAVEAVRRGDDDTKLGHAQLDLVAAPTVASREFELRIARDVRGRADLTELLASGRVRVQVSLLRTDGSPAWRSRAWQHELPPRDAAPVASSAAIPPKDAGAVRVVSWNVLVATPRRKPEPFARVLRALAPDVVLFQEWEGGTDDEIAAWMNAQLPGEPAWHARTSEGWGVAVAARGDLAVLLPEHVPRPADAPADPRRGDRALRLAGGIAPTALGPLCAASLHLKCCGSAVSEQDAARRAETRQANAVLRSAWREHAPCVRVVGGDLNLVGSRAPLEILASGLDGDGGALDVVPTPVLGDDAVYTWSQAWSRFSPGRLDWLLHGRDVRTVRAFVLDAHRLDDATLAAAGIERGDTSVSDHLPLTLDLAR